MNNRLLNYKKACNLVNGILKEKPSIFLNSICTNLAMIEKYLKPHNTKKEWLVWIQDIEAIIKLWGLLLRITII